MDSIIRKLIAVPKIVPIFATEDYGNPSEGYSNPTRRANGEKDALRNRINPIKQPRNAGYILKTFEKTGNSYLGRFGWRDNFNP